MTHINTTGKVYLVWGMFERFPILQIVYATREGAERWIEKHRNDSVVKYEVHEEEVEE